MQYYSSQLQTLLSPLDTSWTECLFPLWPSCFILSGVIHNCPPLFPSSILDTFELGGSSSGVILFCLLILSVGFLKQEYGGGLPFLLYIYYSHIWKHKNNFIHTHYGNFVVLISLWIKKCTVFLLLMDIVQGLKGQKS